jgi:acylphosphatase
MARLLRIAGRAQGLAGWVRNRRDGTVEALLAGEMPAVQAVLLACRRGPPLALVESVEETLAEDPAEPGFGRLPTL